MSWTIISIVISLGFGFISRWIVDLKQRRDYKRRVEAEYAKKVQEIAYKMTDEYEKEHENIKDMSRSERSRYIADRVS